MPIGDGNMEKKIRFTGESNLSPFMKKLQEDAKKLYSDIAKEAKKQTDSDKEQNKFISERLRLLKEELKTKQALAKEDFKRVSGNLNRAAQAFGPDDPRAMFWKEKADRARSEYEDVREQYGAAKQASYHNYRGGDPKESVGKSVFSATLLAGLVKDVLSGLRQTANSENGLSLLSPIASLSGGMAGGATGTLLDKILNAKIAGTGPGDSNMGVIMASIGKEAGGFLGDAITRSFKLRSEYDTAAFGYRGFTGLNANTPGLSGLGFDGTATAQSMLKLAQARGGSGNGVSTMLGLQRGFGINESTTLGAAGLERVGAGGITNAQRGLGIAVAEGINRSKFTDVIANQTAILQEFSKTANLPSNLEANRALFEFNRIGGPFSIGDPRAIGNITAIQEGLSNPGNAFGQAQNYAVLRRLNPNASSFQLRKMQEQGLQTPGFLNAIVGDIAGGSGSEDFKKFQLASRTGLSLDATERLYNNRGKLGSMSQGDLSKILGTDTIQKQAEENTSKLMRYNAEVANAFRDNFLQGISVIKSQFVTELGSAAKEIADILKSEFGFGENKKYKYDGNRNVTGKTPSKNGVMTKQDSVYQETIQDMPIGF